MFVQTKSKIANADGSQVFSPQAFPAEKPPIEDFHLIPGLAYARRHIRLDNETLVDGDGASGDPASLGVSAVMIGQTDQRYLLAAVRQFAHFNMIPRWPNGAISHRESSPQVWADFIYMAPPFVAYLATAVNSTEIMRQAVAQCLLYRQALQPNVSTDAVSAGAWQHILGGDSPDPSLWSTGNAWAAMGMTRVLATLLHWPRTAVEPDAQIAQADLFLWVGEILRAAAGSPLDDGLVRNRLNDTTWFGETSGTALLAATVYRLAVLQEEATSLFNGGAKKLRALHPELQKPVTSEMLEWADKARKAVAAHVDEKGIASPAVDPLDWNGQTPYTKGSPEGQSFLVMLYASWRDCNIAGVCTAG